MSGGQLTVPLVLRTQGGAGQRGGAQHSQSLEAWLTHVPGLKVVMPSRAADAAGLLRERDRRRRPGRVRREQDAVLPPRGGRGRRARPRPDRGRAHRAEGARRHDRRAVADGRRGARGGRAARGRGHRGRGDRPAHARAARPRDDRRLGPAHEPARRRARGGAPRRLRRRDRRAGRPRRSTTSTRRSSASARRSRRSRSARRSRTPTCRARTTSMRRPGRRSGCRSPTPCRRSSWRAPGGASEITRRRRSDAHRSGVPRDPFDPGGRRGGDRALGGGRLRWEQQLVELELVELERAVRQLEHRRGRAGRGRVEVRPRQRPEGDGHADQARRDRHQAAGDRLHRHPEHGEGVLRLRQRQRRHQRPADRLHDRDRADRSGPGGVARPRSSSRATRCSGSSATRSIIECAVNHKYYEQKGYFIIGSGIAPECYSTSNSAAVNMGPRYSVDGATQYLIRQGVKKLVLDQSNVPGTGLQRGRLPAHRQGREHPDGDAQGERPDPGRELGGPQGGPGGRRRWRRRPELHAARGAEDPPGRAAAGPPEPREVGLLDAVQHGLPGPGAGIAVGRQAGRQRRAEPDDGERPRQPALPRRAQEVRAEDPARLVQPDGLHRGAHRHRGAARRQGRVHAESRSTPRSRA